MKYYIIAGEASGDLHTASLTAQLKKLDANAEFRGWGGDLMEKQGVKLVKHYRELAFMGFLEVLANIRTILRNFKFCYKDILQYKPDVLILVDYPGFNLRVAKFAKKHNIKVFYYISPQIWAWKKSRVHAIKKNVDKMFVILPFEKEFYANYNYDVHFTGHPLLDAIAEFQNNFEIEATAPKRENEKPIVALLPGSRKQEIQKVLPVMIEVAEKFIQYKFVLAVAPSQPIQFYKNIIGNTNISFSDGNTYRLLSEAHAALVTSGTATLETALFKVPQVVCYKAGYISYYIARRLIQVKYISLVNLIMNKALVPEMIQFDCTAKKIAEKFAQIANDTPERQNILQGYDTLCKLLGGKGASQRTAELMWSYLNSEKNEE